MSIGARPHPRPLHASLAWLSLSVLAGPGGGAIAHAQQVAPVAAPPAPPPAPAQGGGQAPQLDPQSPLAPMPDIGVAWPDMNQPDMVVELPPEPGAPPEPVAPAQPAQGNAGQGAQPAGEAASAAQGAQPAGEAASAEEAATPAMQIAGERKYRVSLTGIDAIADSQFMLRFNSLSVLKQDENKAANIAQINRRAKEDTDLLDRLMTAKGYYDARIRADILPPAAGEDRLRVVLDITPGQLYKLSEVDVRGLQDTGEREAKLRAAFPVKVGDPVDADRISAAEGSLRTALAENGYPFAKVEDPVVRIDHDDHDGALGMDVASGGFRRFGTIMVSDKALFDAHHIQSIARFHPGDPYQASDVEDLRRALVQTGLVSSVTLTPKDAGDNAHVDLGVDMSPAPPRTIAAEIGYGTGEGYRLEASWQHRNFFPPEGGITVRGVAGTQEQSLGFTFRRNNFQKRDRVLTGILLASHVNRAAYDARTLQLTGTLERQTNLIFQKKWTWSFGGELLASDERSALGVSAIFTRRTYFIAAVPTSLSYDGTDSLLDPTRGFRLSARVSPEVSLQSGAFGYVRAQVDGSVYQPVSDRVVLAARTRIGTIVGAGRDRIAPSRRYYAGGGGSVRGYGYQAIGPRDLNNDPLGGRSLAEFSLEARVRFGNFGVVPFFDAGTISTDVLPHARDLRMGAGIGGRYYSSFGPIRIDLGTPINPQQGDPRIAVYVSLGQAF